MNQIPALVRVFAYLSLLTVGGGIARAGGEHGAEVEIRRAVNLDRVGGIGRRCALWRGALCVSRCSSKHYTKPGKRQAEGPVGRRAPKHAAQREMISHRS